MSETVLDALRGAPGTLSQPAVGSASPLSDDDLQLALYVCYELHYQSFDGVDSDWEWEPSLLASRSRLEAVFLEALGIELDASPDVDPSTLGAWLFDLSRAEQGPSLSRFLERRGTFEHFREFMVHRSAYQLKEADPHTWAIPRLSGRPKAALVEIQADEYGCGAADRMHSRLFAEAMDAVGLDSRYGAYLDHLPGTTLATANLISAFGLRRKLRGALVGHLAAFELTSPVPNRRYANALRRLGFGSRATAFYDEHVEADSVHENVAAYDLAQRLAESEPELTADIAFGARSLMLLEDRFAARLLHSWERGESSLLPVPRPRLATPAA